MCVHYAQKSEMQLFNFSSLPKRKCAHRLYKFKELLN